MYGEVVHAKQGSYSNPSINDLTSSVSAFVDRVESNTKTTL